MLGETGYNYYKKILAEIDSIQQNKAIVGALIRIFANNVKRVINDCIFLSLQGKN